MALSLGIMKKWLLLLFYFDLWGWPVKGIGAKMTLTTY